MAKNTTLQDLQELSELATAYALTGKWELAIKTNKEVVSADPKNVDALNRLGFAYIEIGKKKDAATILRKVLRLDPCNQIAARNLRRLKSAPQRTQKAFTDLTSSQNLFLEEPGKTITVALVSPAEPKIILSLSCADPIKIVPKTHQISVTDVSGKYLGKLPDDLAARLIRLIQGGNHYDGYIKSVNESQVQVFLRETKRAKRLESVHSFPFEEKFSYVAFTPPGLIHHEQPETRTLEDLEAAEETPEEPEEESSN